MLRADKEAFLPGMRRWAQSVRSCAWELRMVGWMMKKVMETSSAWVFVPSTISADGKHLHGPSKEIPPFSPSPFSLIYYMKEITLTCPPALCSQVCLLLSVWKILEECGGSGCFLQ